MVACNLNFSLENSTWNFDNHFKKLIQRHYYSEPDTMIYVEIQY